MLHVQGAGGLRLVRLDVVIGAGHVHGRVIHWRSSQLPVDIGALVLWKHFVLCLVFGVHIMFLVRGHHGLRLVLQFVTVSDRCMHTRQRVWQQQCLEHMRVWRPHAVVLLPRHLPRSLNHLCESILVLVVYRAAVLWVVLVAISVAAGHVLRGQLPGCPVRPVPL